MAELAAGVAHELRNPLNAIGTLVQQVDKDFVSNVNNEELHQLLKSEKKLPEWMTRSVIFYVLHVRHCRRKRKLQFQNGWKISALEIEAMGTAKKVNFRIEYPKHFSVIADTNQLSEIIRNLVRNSFFMTIEYSGNISIEIKTDKEEFEIAVVMITDLSWTGQTADLRFVFYNETGWDRNPDWQWWQVVL